LLPADKKPPELKDANVHADPLHTKSSSSVELKYNVPSYVASRVLPSLSAVGAVDLAPKYCFSKLVNDVALDVAEFALAVAELAEFVAWVLAVLL
tara:strand:+ start:1265 stop:1549 length:285 start_codon:yes stop_codon:yes gene_type:complete